MGAFVAFHRLDSIDRRLIISIYLSCAKSIPILELVEVACASLVPQWSDSSSIQRISRLANSQDEAFLHSSDWLVRLHDMGRLFQREKTRFSSFPTGELVDKSRRHQRDFHRYSMMGTMCDMYRYRSKYVNIFFCDLFCWLSIATTNRQTSRQTDRDDYLIVVVVVLVPFLVCSLSLDDASTQH
jgi:hypothetical protein